MNEDEQIFLSHVPEDGTGIGLGRLRRTLAWGDTRFEEVKSSLIRQGAIIPWTGRGGSVKRASASDEEKTLLQGLEELGGAAGNISLLRQLGWGDERYYRVRDRLIDQGELVRGPGRGGSVRIVAEVEASTLDDDEEAAEPTSTPVEPDPAPATEADLYPAIERVLRESWAKDLGFAWSHVAVTARQGRRATGGRWTRPDLTVLSLKRYRYLPGLHMEVWSFEVKLLQFLDVSAVYEAVAHTRFSTRAYLIFPLPERPDESQTSLLEEVEAEAARHGVGIITVIDAGDYSTWEERVKPIRTNAEPERINEFIGQQVSSDAQAELQDELRGA